MTNLTQTGNFPLYLTKPHFLEADPSLQSTVSGLDPDPVAHLTYVDVEPISGVTFDTHKRVQLNMGLSDLTFRGGLELEVEALLLLLDLPRKGRLHQCMVQEVDWRFLGGSLIHPVVWYAAPH